jgi:hypothetical protein
MDLRRIVRPFSMKKHNIFEELFHDSFDGMKKMSKKGSQTVTFPYFRLSGVIKCKSPYE